MKFTLLPFQEETVADLVSHIRNSIDEVGRVGLQGAGQAVVLVAPTGAGKTVMAAAALENLFFGDGQSLGEDDELPAQAGVSPARPTRSGGSVSAPRASGGESRHRRAARRPDRCSPRKRG